MCVVGFIFWAVGYWIIWMRPTDIKARVLFFLFLSFMLFWTLNLTPPMSEPLRSFVLVLNTVAFTTMPAFFLYFFLLFPERHRGLQAAASTTTALNAEGVQRALARVIGHCGLKKRSRPTACATATPPT
jgi:hypothetical protein